MERVLTFEECAKGTIAFLAEMDDILDGCEIDDEITNSEEVRAILVSMNIAEGDVNVEQCVILSVEPICDHVEGDLKKGKRPQKIIGIKVKSRWFANIYPKGRLSGIYESRIIKGTVTLVFGEDGKYEVREISGESVQLKEEENPFER